MCLLIKDQGQKHLTWPTLSPQTGNWTPKLNTAIYRPQWELKNPRCEGRPHIHESLRNFLLRTFTYYLCPHLAMSAPHRHSQAFFGSDNTLFILLVYFIHSMNMHRVSPGAELWKHKNEWGMSPILSTLSIASFFKRRAGWNWWGRWGKHPGKRFQKFDNASEAS